MDLPHRWLGEEFRALLSELRTQPNTVRIAITRPSGRSYGEGALRVVRVTEEDRSTQLVLAYERYRYLPRPDESANPGARREPSS